MRLPRKGKISVIDPRAIIDPTATIGENVSIGPWSIVGPDVKIGNNCTIASHVVIKGPTEIGSDNKIYQFSTIGDDTPDLKYKGEKTKLIIGDHNTCLLYTSPSPRDRSLSRMPSSA